MKERPILFSAPMVRAILEGRKTQTRRAAKHTLLETLSRIIDCGNGWWGDEEGEIQVRCPYGQPGDRLWVRETWAPLEAAGTPYIYRADADEDGSVPYLIHGSPMGGGVGHANPHRWKPSIHMPRRASRILLEVVSVRVERLQDISDADAKAEGVIWDDAGQYWQPSEDINCPCCFAYGAYAELWESINGPKSWDANPWVWVVEFRRVTA